MDKVLNLAYDNTDFSIDKIGTDSSKSIIDIPKSVKTPDCYVEFVSKEAKGKINIVGCAAYSPSGINREISFSHIDSKYRKEGFPIYYGTSDRELFNRAAARNSAINCSTQENEAAEVIFIFDTDVLVDVKNIWAAAYMAKITGCIVVAFSDYYYLREPATAKALTGIIDQNYIGGKWNHLSGGAICVPVELWKETGGYDERFDSWGGEDRSFYHVCNAIKGRTHAYRLPGTAVHFYHNRPVDSNPNHVKYAHVLSLGSRYKMAAGRFDRTGCLPEIDGGGIREINKDEIYSILKEPGAPLSETPLRQGRVLPYEEIPKKEFCVFFNQTGKGVVAEVGSDLDIRLTKAIASGTWRREDVRY